MTKTAILYKGQEPTGEQVDEIEDAKIDLLYSTMIHRSLRLPWKKLLCLSQKVETDFAVFLD